MSDNQINADQLDHAISNLDQHILAWRKRGPVGKLHSIVRYIRSSPQRRHAFESRQEEAEVARTVRLMLNGGIRWNSTYNMIARAIRLKSAIDEYILHTPDLREDALTADDWHELAELLRLLKPLKRSTEDLEGNPTHGRGGALWEVLAHMERNLRELESEKARLADRMEAPHLQASINLGWQVLDKYYRLTDETPAYRAAVVLHPMIKWTFFERNWPHEWIERAQKEVKTLWKSYKTTGTPKKARQALPQPPDSQLRPDWHDHEWEEQMNNFIFATASSDTNLDEYHRYLAEPAPTGDPRAFDVLQWWIEHLYDYPQLSKMALDLLACPAMSADCERAFLSAGRNISKTRSRINDETAEATECLRSWLKQGWIDIEHWIVNGGMNKEDPEGEDDMDEDG
ncbi:HAT domain-containing protein [Macrophomina phaseolina MS6]|uniref:HAT domain-containing protein n=1 Tax=Macrophomina phaseolina (strain MS6) TaxID=1126212 RepID=K2R4P3_MACPH|nr:HAT domain-containing protein [Macrophomina phaseolina MS6]